MIQCRPYSSNWLSTNLLGRNIDDDDDDGSAQSSSDTKGVAGEEDDDDIAAAAVASFFERHGGRLASQAWLEERSSVTASSKAKARASLRVQASTESQQNPMEPRKTEAIKCMSGGKWPPPSIRCEPYIALLMKLRGRIPHSLVLKQHLQHLALTLCHHHHHHV